MGFWTKVNDILVDRDMTRKALAIESDVPKYTIDKGIERDSNATFETAYKICHTLRIPIESVLDITPENKDLISKEKERREKLSVKYSDILECLESMSPENVEIIRQIVGKLK